ncbi:MAG TPA: S1/P1 nuclease [Flavisolibacter sp.]|jgi:hypothetical protein|nr:S1/P1 nuclease [Flavisolibacter sp.]
MKRYLKLLVVAAALFYIPLKSFAWGLLGHRIIGEIAYSYLTPKAKSEVQKILGYESMAMASNWADFVRSDTSFKYLDSWHYIDFDKDMPYAEMKRLLQSDTAHDAYTAIVFLKKELKKKNIPLDKKQMYLRLLIHIVGDIHQPLHVSKSGDMGGNDIKVSWFGVSSNLHRVWDSQLIDNQQLSYTEYTNAINHISKASRLLLQKQPLSQWIYDSYLISNKLHADIKTPDPKLSYLYVYQHLSIVNEQLLKGGIHLAAILNDIFR